MKDNKKILIIFAIGILFFGAVFGGITLFNRMNKSNRQVNKDNARAKLERIVNRIDPIEMEARKASISFETKSLADELPEISKYPLSVTGNGAIDIEIFSSGEKAGKGTDGWLNEVAQQFNNEHYDIGGKSVSVSVRSISSGQGADYIISGKYLPDAYTPSNELWGSIINEEGGKVTVADDRLVGNVAGILVSKKTESLIAEKYGDVSIKTVVEATANNDIAMGYTNPLTSATGMNFLLSTLYAYDSSNVLSSNAVSGFQSFQTNVPYVAFTTQQMRDSVKNGSFDGMVMEYQSYVNDVELKNSYTFIPFGVRHDNPLYAVGDLSSDKKKALDMFIQYCDSEPAQKLATKDGFNQLDDYKSEQPEFTGNEIVQAQTLWKENKNSGKQIIAVFVADVSGSMSGDPLNQLKESLINGAQYIDEKNSIGLVSYDSDVYINLPIGEFDLNQRAYFQGAVEDMSAGGTTATYDGLAVAMQMLDEAQQDNPDAKCMIFLLSDGETNAGHSFGKVSPLLRAYEYPVYTIGYNADLAELQEISDVNEAASINADSDDVIYKIKSLFNSEM